MTSKIKIKLGPVEVEYEGSEDFLKKELPELLTAISKLYKESGIMVPPAPPLGGPAGGAPGNVVGTTGTIAAKLSATSGPDLALAAAVRLAIVGGQGSFSRDQLLNEMKSATSYYKKNYSGNLTKILAGLVKAGKFVETAKSTYALSATTTTELGTRLAS